MSGTQVTVPLQLLCRLMMAGQLYENVTLPSIQNSSWDKPSVPQELPSGYVAFPELGVAYKTFISQVSHGDAKKRCLEEGGQLAVIDSREKVDKITNTFAGSPGWWVGLGRGSFYGTSEWTTVDGKSTHNLPWAREEPSGNSRCVFLSKPRNGLVNYNCPSSHDYLCEIALPRN